MTDERPTPETDELSQSIITHNNTYACYEQMKMHAQRLERERDAERALADRLGNALEKIPWTFAGREEQASEEWNALAAWKEARND